MATEAAAWTPPEKPDPQAILSEARADRVAKRYDDALQKHLWFHSEALRIRPAMYGVRLSFALGDWGNLASKHPPAMAALRKVRAEAAAKVLAGTDTLEAFHDLSAIDRELDEYAATLELFRLIESRDAAMARKAYRSAREALIEMNDFTTAARYMDPDEELRFAVSSYRDMAKQKLPSPEILAELRERMFGNYAGRVAAILVLGGKPADAKRIAAEALQVSDSPLVKETMARAAEGQLPPPMVSRADKAMLRSVMP